MDNSSNNRITVNVRLSPQIADTLGTNRVSVIVDESSTVTDVKEEIKKITLEISAFASNYFKSKGKELHSPYQKMIQNMLDMYVRAQQS